MIAIWQRGQVRFRDQLVAASLKDRITPGNARPPLGFRDQLVAASLKDDGWHAQDRELHRFRDQLVAASLKAEHDASAPDHSSVSATNWSRPH